MWAKTIKWAIDSVMYSDVGWRFPIIITVYKKLLLISKV